MKIRTRSHIFLVVMLVLLGALSVASCSGTVDQQTSVQVDNQQDHYRKVQPLHYYDYSIPLDVLQQIYDITVSEAVATYTVAETITGVTKFRCASIGYAIPADTQLTNPLRTVGNSWQGSVVEQPEPNGLYSSTNTDGTWVLCVGDDGIAYPYYSEHKVQVWPFPVYNDESGEWHQMPNTSANVTVDTTNISKEIGVYLDPGLTTLDTP